MRSYCWCYLCYLRDLGLIGLSPIVVKEALALVNVLSAGEHLISNARVDAYTDNTAFVHSWGKQGGKNTELNSVLKSLYDISAVFHSVRPQPS